MLFYSAFVLFVFFVANYKEPLIFRLYRRLWRWHYELFERRRAQHIVQERVAGLTIVVWPSVLNPRVFVSGAFFAEFIAHYPLPPGTRVLDLGCGSGIVGLAAAQRGATVVALDINPAAVGCTRQNTLRSDLAERITICQGDLFAPLKGSFDLVLFNPPYLRGTARSWAERAFFDDGVIARFAAGLSEQLAPGGIALVLLSTIADLDGILATFRTRGLDVQAIAERQLVSERMIIYRLTNDASAAAFTTPAQQH
ncbi:methyltransferase [Candidatus Gracilibacteria bacterium]|nr:methyltransferase [Candidatus Gracilibacteria bacterium]